MSSEINDISILRELAREKLDIASSSAQTKNIQLWRDTNDIHMTVPPVYINEIPWHEMNVEDELTPKACDPFYRAIESRLRSEIYLWKHMPGNMVIQPYIECPVKINDSGFGINEKVDIVKTDEKSSVVSRHFNIQIKNEEDIYKIKDPIITLDNEKTDETYNKLKYVFDGIIEVKKTGVKGYWFTPWDNLVRWTGIAEAMVDLIDRPEYIEKLVKRFVDASIIRLEQYENLGVWASNNDSTRVGSGGYGYCSSLAKPENLSLNAPLKELWGCGNSQIFSEVSPDMHWEFSLKHELRWIERFGLSYYGCCEPLHNKLEMLGKIPNLRKVSMSPWAKLEKVRDWAKDRYVLSCKPSPAIFAGEYWSEERARADILEILKQTEGLSIEIVMKDISTVSYKPHRLWAWSEIALNTVKEYYG